MILLDTHIVIWLLGEPERISPAAKQAILQAQIDGWSLAISCQSLYEIARGMTRGRISVDMSVESFLERIESQFQVWPVSKEAARLAAEFPAAFPSDPCDRIIAGTALAEGFALITADQHIRRSHAVKTIW